MAQPKKFGAFAGVFTPSILTILGVIMYMRLGWVVGEAGLYSAIAIILLAHVISISTGLSISSIATDKRIKTGGIYYILSRSLGLPMGGSIGITLFVGTALSISLYIVGFCESFLSIQALRDFLHLGNTVNDYRILGTAILVSLVVLAFISTSLAIKTQFLILAAIVLSLISITVGFFIHPELHPTEVLLAPVKNHQPLEIIFAIFFPAVTGFTAGVAMSGDLKDPKKNIPSGTMIAIGVGFVVYIALAVAFAFFVKRDVLIGDLNFIRKIAWIPLLVIAGIWGATLSSALGGILGGPRILQAISQDKVTPKIFAKGHGENNEPRNALIFIFILAELGILIGELDVIAKVVSMFYLASYGFINFAYILENWASTDFRPTFKIPTIIGTIGFIACFGVMLKLDTISMIVALVIMIGIFFLLKKKELQLEYGDVWQSVWNSIIRTALHRMDKKEIEERNWQPNIILFSGGTSRRPYLLEFGKSLVGRHGMLSNFDLFENKSDKFLFPKHKQSIQNKEDNKGVFTRKQSCRNIYEGIETIASTYGFSGVEPNTILMGWIRQSQNPVRFVQMLRNLSSLDLNILLVDYDKRYGFGKYKQIDIWWRGAGNQGNFALTLSKFIWSSHKWRDAKVRLIVVISDTETDTILIHKKAERVFNKLRINAELKIINNLIEQKPFYDIIRVESLTTDLIFLGIPEIAEGKEQHFVEATSRLMRDIGTVVLAKASSQFRELNFGTGFFTNRIKQVWSGDTVIEKDIKIPEVILPANTTAAQQIEQLINQIKNLNNEVVNKYFGNLWGGNSVLFDDFKFLVEKTFENLNQKLKEAKTPENFERIINIIQNNFLIRSRKIINERRKELPDSQKDLLQHGLSFFLNRIYDLTENLPQHIYYNYEVKDLLPKYSDNRILKWYKFRKRLGVKISGNPFLYVVEYNRLSKSILLNDTHELLYQTAKYWGVLSYRYIYELQRIIKLIRGNLFNLSNKISSAEDFEDLVNLEKEKALKNLENLNNLNDEIKFKINSIILQNTMGSVQKISNSLSKIDVNSFIINGVGKQLRQKENELKQLPNLWLKNQNLNYNSVIIELLLISFENRLRKVLIETQNQIRKEVENSVLKNLNQLNSILEEYLTDLKENNSSNIELEKLFDGDESEKLIQTFQTIINTTFRNIKLAVDKFPETIDIISDESQNNFAEKQFSKIDIIHISASRLLDYLVQNELVEPMQKLIDELPNKLLKIDALTKDVVRLIIFSTQHIDESSELGSSNIWDTVNFIEEQKAKIEQQITDAKEYKNSVEEMLEERLTATINKLSLYSFAKIAVNLKQYLQDQETKKTFSQINKKYKTVNNFFNRQFDQFWYRQSRAVLMAKDINADDNKSNTRVNDLLNLLETVSIDENTLSKLPFYYQQLFLRKHNYYNEFWFGRRKELKEVEKSITRFKAGYSGGILITGEQGSGKTFFSQYIVSHYFTKSDVFYIYPPSGGSTQTEDFLKKLQKAVGINGSYRNIFSNISDGSIFILDDLELWWEKSPEGFKVIERIVKLIEEFSYKTLFIVNVNKYSFELMNKIRKIEDSFLNIIECSPFDAECLKDIILFRHKSSGLNLKIKNKKEENLRSVDYANFFAKLFNYSEGNVGVALSAWMASIKDIENNTVDVNPLKLSDISILDYLDTEYLVYIVQFILHKQLTIQRLKNILVENDEMICNKINFLKRSGIIIEEINNIYQLNTFLQIHLLKTLKEKEML